MKNNTESLRIVGLSEREALTYVDLQEYGESKTGRICERTKIPSSQIYTILYSLLEKGLVNFKTVNSIKLFRASNADALARLFEEKEEQLQDEKKKLLQTISKLKVPQNALSRISDYQYFSGVRGIKSLYAEVINAWRAGDEYYIASAPLKSFKKLEGFFLAIVHKKRVRDKVKLKILINKDNEK